MTAENIVPPVITTTYSNNSSPLAFLQHSLSFSPSTNNLTHYNLIIDYNGASKHLNNQTLSYSELTVMIMNSFRYDTENDMNMKLLSLITGIRLQPLVDLRSEKTIAWEVLSQVTEPDSLFSSLPKEYHLVLFLWQANEVLRTKGQFWLNLPAQALLDPRCLSLLLKQEHQNRLTIEIQDPQTLLELNTLEMMQFKTGISLLRNAGWRVWLDDITSALAPDIMLLGLSVDGVKIDRNEFNDLAKLSRLAELVKTISHEILLEGIESRDMLDAAGFTPATYGQGFYWPELKISLPVPPYCIEQAHSLSLENMITECRQTKVMISCEDRYFQQGLEYLLWSLLQVQFCTQLIMPIRLTRNEAEANIILLDGDVLERPFECSLSVSRNRAMQRHQFKQFIMIYKDKINRRLYRCPEIEGSLSVMDKTAHALELIKQMLKRTLKEEQHDTSLVKNSACAQCKINRLTLRERDIFRQMANGASLLYLAIQYGCKVKTVSAHKRSAMRKLNIKNNIALYRYLKLTAESSPE